MIEATVLKKRKLEDLKQLCRDNGLYTSGNKPALIGYADVHGDVVMPGILHCADKNTGDYLR